MAHSPAARLLDPLGAQDSAALGVIPPAGVERRWERIAPEVTAMDGGEAVAIVRASGFVAAIEPVPSELPEGTVIEQEPAVGMRLGREAVVTLRLAVAPLDVTRAATAIEGDAASERVPRTADPDDTEEWFAALSPSVRDARRGGPSARRRRKHRPSRPSAHELVFDPAPAPSVRPRQPADTITHLERTRSRAKLWLLTTSAIFAFPPSLTGMPWRRASALVVGLLVLELLGMRLFASSDRRVQSTDHRALGRSLHAQITARESVSRTQPLPRRALGSRHEQDAGRARSGRAHRRARARNADTATVAAIAARPAHSPQAAAGPSATAARSISGQFAYLGQ